MHGHAVFAAPFRPSIEQVPLISVPAKAPPPSFFQFIGLFNDNKLLKFFEIHNKVLKRLSYPTKKKQPTFKSIARSLCFILLSLICHNELKQVAV